MRMLCFDANPNGRPSRIFPGIALAAVGIGLLAMTGLAQASSIVVLGVATSTPSVVRLPSIEPGRVSAASTPSIVGLDEPVPAVTEEKVAAIPEKSGQRHAQAPTIIRGGIVGGASAAPAASAPATAPAAATPANGSAPAAATPPNGTAAAPPNGDAKAADDKAAAENKAAATASASDEQAQSKAQPQEPPVSPRFSKAM